MISASWADRQLVVDILSAAFENNKSVNYIVRQDAHRLRSIRRLMEYAFDSCSRFGRVYLSDDRNACALLLCPDRKKTTWTSVWLDVKLLLGAIGIYNMRKVITRDAKIKKLQANGLSYYLWFIGVHTNAQHQGIGSNLMQELIDEANGSGRVIFLETSTERNLPWYQHLGFRIYNQLDLGYTLYFLKKNSA
jgi:ribosomal protein S18 acetylase RimI-like enzyme